MSITTDMDGLSTDGTLQRFTLSTTAQTAAADLDVAEFDALLAANDPDSAHALGPVSGVRAHVRGDLVTVVDLRHDLVTDVRRAAWLDGGYGAVA